jgi:hypothetical protein
VTAYTPNTPLSRRLLSSQKTRLGWWSLGLAAVFVVLLIFGVILEVLAVSVTNSVAISTALRRSCALLLEVL